jgi:hypothetical protein
VETTLWTYDLLRSHQRVPLRGQLGLADRTRGILSASLVRLQVEKNEYRKIACGGLAESHKVTLQDDVWKSDGAVHDEDMAGFGCIWTGVTWYHGPLSGVLWVSPESSSDLPSEALDSALGQAENLSPLALWSGLGIVNLKVGAFGRVPINYSFPWSPIWNGWGTSSFSQRRIYWNICGYRRRIVPLL